MNYRNDESYRAAALDLYAHLEKEANDSISPTLKMRTAQLEKKTFLLAVVGEVKAGKSTFLNALLKDDVLPSDILQSTSAIIQIVKSDSKYITITYANQTKETFREDIAERLRAIGSVQENEQDIPTVQLNKFLKEHWDGNAKSARWDDSDFKKLCKSVSNSRNIEPTNFAQKISLYLQNHNSLNIPDSIQIGFL
jgi:GTPase SAR1 family protein